MRHKIVVLLVLLVSFTFIAVVFAQANGEIDNICNDAFVQYLDKRGVKSFLITSACREASQLVRNNKMDKGEAIRKAFGVMSIFERNLDDKTIETAISLLEKDKIQQRVGSLKKKDGMKKPLIVKGIYIGMPLDKAIKVIETKYPKGVSGKVHRRGSDEFNWGIQLKGKPVQSIQLSADKNKKVNSILLLHLDVLFNVHNISMKDAVNLFSKAYKIVTPWKKLKVTSTSDKLKNGNLSMQHIMETSNPAGGYRVRIRSSKDGRAPVGIYILKYEAPAKTSKPKFD